MSDQNPRDGLVAIQAALDEMRRNVYPQPDKPESAWAKWQAANVALVALRTSHPNAAEPVAYLYERPNTVFPQKRRWVEICKLDGDAGGFTVIPLYAHPPAPQDNARADVRGLVEKVRRGVEAAARGGHFPDAIMRELEPTILAAFNPTGEA